MVYMETGKLPWRTRLACVGWLLALVINTARAWRAVNAKNYPLTAPWQRRKARWDLLCESWYEFEVLFYSLVKGR